MNNLELKKGESREEVKEEGDFQSKIKKDNSIENDIDHLKP